MRNRTRARALRGIILGGLNGRIQRRLDRIDTAFFAGYAGKELPESWRRKRAYAAAYRRGARGVKWVSSLVSGSIKDRELLDIAHRARRAIETVFGAAPKWRGNSLES